MALPYGALGWSTVYNCGISWSYSHVFKLKFLFELKYMLCGLIEMVLLKTQNIHLDLSIDELVGA